MPERGPDLIARVSFPLYAACHLTHRHIVIAGGGGSSKTGIFNGFAVYEVDCDGLSWRAREVARHDTGSQVVMNLALHDDGKRVFLAVGQDADTQIYQLELELTDATASEGGSDAESDPVRFRIQAAHRVQTDFGKKDQCQNVVRISRNGKMAVTGGTDGYVRLWSFPQMLPLIKIKAYDKEICDVDISPDQKVVASIAKGPDCLISNATDGSKMFTLKWNPPDSAEYRFKRCRFGVVDKQPDKAHLFTIVNPASRQQTKSYLQLWVGPDFALKTATAVSDILSALAVSRDGKFVAVGSMTTGDVDIFIGFSLQRVKHVENVHKTFVTALEFLPRSVDDGSDDEVSLVSMSIDNHLYLHHIDKPLTLPAWFVVVIILAVLISTFMFCSYLGL